MGAPSLLFIRFHQGMGALFRIEVHAELDLSGHEARSCGRILPVIRIAPKSSDRPQSRSANIAQATDWLVHLHHPFLGGMWLTRSVVCEEGDIIP